MKNVWNSFDGAQQFFNCFNAPQLQNSHECEALLKAEDVRMSHLTSNWFHQTWKLHCYLVFCLSGEIQEYNKAQ